MMTIKIYSEDEYCVNGAAAEECANCGEALYNGDEAILSAGEYYCCRTCADEAAQEAAVEPEMVRPRRTRVASGDSTLDVRGWEFYDGRD